MHGDAGRITLLPEAGPAARAAHQVAVTELAQAATTGGTHPCDVGFGREVVEKVRVGDAIFAGMRKHFSDQEIVETIVALGFYMMMARLTEATETDLDPAAGMKVYDGGKK